MDPRLERRAREWLAIDPDPDTRAELEALLAASDTAGLESRFDGRLQFGTAGLRGALGAGPLRMNRVIVRRAAAGLAAYLLDKVPDAAERGVAIGFDARHKSAVFADDSARVFAAAGLRAWRLPGPLPTPMLAFAVRHLGAAAGVMVTASHNPPSDNGYKVYLDDGSQIVPPIDGQISSYIDSVGEIALTELDDPRIGAVDVRHDYIDAVCALTFVPDARDVRVAYSALHGVGRDTLIAAFERAGFPPPIVVASQGEPDPDFPTVAFPNPEEPGATDRLIAEAQHSGADIALANDPDADRLAVAIPDSRAANGWRQLSGNEVGYLLADHVLAHTRGADRLVVTTVVSSRLLSRLAAEAGVHYAETLTGFKWIAKEIRERQSAGQRFVFGYEEALGYLIGDVVRDKDGISAALVMAEIAALAKRDGVGLDERLDAIGARVGRYRTAQWSLRADAQTIHALLARLHEAPPHELGGFRVQRVDERPEASLVTLSLGGDNRVLVRPSGTEPKVKVYVEVVDDDPERVVAAVRQWVKIATDIVYQSPN